MYTNVKYTEDGSITADIDGVAHFIPDDMGNRHRREIQEWIDAGGKIEKYKKPASTNNDVNNERDRRRSLPLEVKIKGVGIIPVQVREKDVPNLTLLDSFAKSKFTDKDKSKMVFHDAENVDHELTPVQVSDIVAAAFAHIQSLNSKAWILKGLDPIPEDYANDKYWV